MRFLATILLATTVTCATLSRRTAQEVYDSITAIDTAVRHLTDTLNAYQGGINQSIPVFDASTYIHSVNRAGFALATASAPFSQPDSQRIVAHTNNTVAVSIPNGVTILEAKKPLFDAAQLSSIVGAYVKLLRYDHDTFSAAIGAKLTPGQAPGGLAAAGKIDASLAGAEVVYRVPA